MEQISLLHAIILGIIQGATEFLPVSSSAHLVIFQDLLNIDIGAGPIVAFDVCLHIGTLLAVVVALRKDIAGIVLFRRSSVARPPRLALHGGQVGRRSQVEVSNDERRMTNDKMNQWYIIWLLVLGTVPAVIIGFSFKDFFERLFTSTLHVGIALIVTGVILFATRFVKKNDIELKNMRWWQAVLVGAAQAIAIIPGISRSGSTIATGLFLGLDRQLAAKFSFLLAIIAIGGAAVLEWKNLRYISGENLLPIIVGTFAAFVVGYICVKWMLEIVRGTRFSWFAIYCWMVGIVTIVVSYMS